MVKINKAAKDDALDERSQAFQSHADDMNGSAEPEKKEEAPAPTVAELLVQIGELKAQQEAMREQNLTLLTQPQTTLQPKAPGEVSYDNLPNPADYPKEYGEELGKRVQKNWEDKQAHRQRLETDARSQEQRLEEVLEDIAIQYPEIAEDRDVLDFAAAQTVKAAMKRGIDRDRYVFGNRDRFIKDVKKTFDAKFARKAQEDDNSDRDTGRAASILGGQDGSAPRREQDQEPRQRETGFIKEMRDMQAKLGIM